MPELKSDDGALLHYEERGAGRPVLLLHSLGGSGAMWADTVDALSNGMRVITLDARGHGASGDEGDFTVERYATDAIELLSQLELESACLVGLSMGAQAAMLVASTRAGSVTHLVLADTHLGGMGAETAHERRRSTSARIAEIGPEAFALEYTRSRLMPSTGDDVVRQFSAMVVRTLPDIYPTLQHSIAMQDLEAPARLIASRTLVMVGDSDRSTPVERARAVQGAIANAGLAVIPEANHLSNLDNPVFFNARLKSFLLETDV